MEFSEMDVDDQPERPRVPEPQPQGWSKEDKYRLLQALKCCNSSSTENIIALLPSKTAEEIEDMIDYYKRRAAKHPLMTKRVPTSRRVLDKISRTPIAMWAKLLTDAFSFKELETETPTALHLIAEFEDIPKAVCTGGADFRAMYHCLGNAMEGKNIPDDKLLNAVLEKCILETAYSAKAFMRRSAFRSVLGDINFSDKEINVFPRPTENQELATLRHLSSQRKYNPLNINESYLKPSYNDYHIL